MTKHVIVGGGPVATNAIETIRQFDSGASQITLVCDEPAHSRMALPYWLSGQIPREQTHTGDDAYFQKLSVDALIGTRANSLDVAGKTLSLDNGQTLEFDKLLIATGASPVALSIPGADLPGVQSLWTLDHTDRLLAATQSLERPRVLMIGAGFIGFIVLNAMHKRGWALTVVEREAHVLPRMLDADAAAIVESWLTNKGIQLHCGTSVQSIAAADDGALRVELDDSSTVIVDRVIVAVGITPNLELVQGTGIDVKDGIVVNQHMQTSVADVYAGGDVAQGPTLYGGDPEIHSIQPTAVDHGRVAGANMAGQDVSYPGSLSMNILDTCGLQNASFGNWADHAAEALTISNTDGHVYRKLLWSDDEITGAVFVGQANDLGMLTDVGMVKGIMQTRTALGPWKTYLKENSFDIRRAYVATGVAQKLAGMTLLGRPSQTRQFRFQGAKVSNQPTAAHANFVSTKAD